MVDLPDPKIIVNERFKDTELLANAAGWDLGFRQIDHGPLNARLVQFGHAQISVIRIELNRSFHQIGTPPSGVLTFGLPDKDSGSLRWKGIETPPGVLINFNYEKTLDCVSSAPFGGFLLSFHEELLQQVVQKMRYGQQHIDDTKSRRFWDTDVQDCDQLRQHLQALEKVVTDDGDQGLKHWKGVFNSDLATLIIRITSRESSTPKMSASTFRSSAMNRAIEILGDHNQFPINIEALCTMVGASWATLQRAFAEEFGVTPSSYVKSRRLAAVQSELIKNAPEVVISDVANRWGFWHMGSFAADYRKQFGELPSETLNRLKSQEP